MTRTSIWLALGLALALAALAGCKKREIPKGSEARPEAGIETVALRDRAAVMPVAIGLPPDDARQFYTLSEGSELYPLSWLSIIEHDGKPFTDDLARFGFIFAGEVRDNRPWPVGLTVQSPPDLGFPMIGVNCAACHVGELHHGDSHVRIDGAPNHFDIERFYSDLVAATGAALKDKQLRKRLLRALRDDLHDSLQPVDPAKHVPGFDTLQKEGGAGAVVVDAVDTTLDAEWEAFDIAVAADRDGQLQAYLVGDELDRGSVDDLLKGVDVTQPDFLNGAGPLASVELRNPKAFFRRFNEIRRRARMFHARLKFIEAVIRRDAKDTKPLFGRVDAFGYARNFLFGLKHGFQNNTAPIAYPHLWGMRKTKWLHWNGNTNSVMARNIGQALGVGAIVNLRTKDRYRTSVLVENIHELERLAYRLEPPAWPAAWPQPVDELRKRGAAVYQEQKCGTCHGVFTLEDGLEAYPMYALDKIGTDPEQATSFERELSAGVKFDVELAKLLAAVEAKYVADHAGVETAEWNDQRKDIVWRSPLEYPARPLVGVWATAPYLHNNSVPTLYQLLLPPDERVAKFKVGDRTYDLEEAGYRYQIDAATDLSHIVDTSQTGNTRGGHAYFNGSDADRRALVAYLKTL